MKVKILKPIGRYKENEVVDVSEEEAKNITRIVRTQWDSKFVETQFAVSLDAWEKNQNVDPEFGGRTVVETPKDDDFAKKLAKGIPAVSISKSAPLPLTGKK